MYQPTERWKALCEQAAVEQDSARLLEIINELNRVLDDRAKGTRQQEGTNLAVSLKCIGGR